MREEGSEGWLSANIPGSVASTLIAHGKMEHPYYRDNENKVLPAFEKNYIFRRNFCLTAEYLTHDMVQLRCDGLDTLADIRLNGVSLASTDNMHVRYSFDVKALLRVGENEIEITFCSPLAHVAQNPSLIGKPFTSIRKAACMFGWDWGLNLPDSGIWRDIYIDTFDTAKIGHTQICQTHENGMVKLNIRARCETQEEIEVRVRISDPEEVAIVTSTQSVVPGQEAAFLLCITKPELWWPSGYGGQPLYTVETVLLKNGQLLDKQEQKIGLRTVKLNREDDADGAKYQFVVNGSPIFFRGENLIIEDSLISQTDDARWERLISNCLKSNLNGLRVWGGAYYPPEIFYDLCDRHGLLVFQDFMFACSFYATDAAFIESVAAEAEDNLKRIGHHTCIGLYCGNNEIDSIYTVMRSTEPETAALRKTFGREEAIRIEIQEYIWGMYKEIFLELLPTLCEKYAPDTDYVHSSPSVGEPGGAESFFDFLSGGDMHYYLQYNGNAPYQKMRSMRCRFMTEMGFQSYPSMKTIEKFTDETDRNPYSPVMYSHQKCNNGNEAIELYMERDYIVPSSFEDYVYLSQLQAGEIMKYSVEHLRRDSEYCSGVILWQLNDCWPVVSWSGIDYYGRWKALQYYIRRFYSPVLISAQDVDLQVGLWLSNHGLQTAEGTISWTLRDAASVILQKGAMDVCAASGSSREWISLDFSDYITQEKRSKIYLEYSFSRAGERVSQGTLLFTVAKDFAFEKPSIHLSVAEEEKAYQITVSTDCFVKGLALDVKDADCIFSDNFFDLSAGEKRVISVEFNDVEGVQSRADFESKLWATSLNEVLLKGKCV